MSVAELDVRGLPKPDRHPVIFKRFAALGVGESFVLVNNHDPRHLRSEFEIEYPDSFDWTYLQRDPGVWRIQISRLVSTPLPQLLCNAHDVGGTSLPADAAGAIWRLEPEQRQLDANIIHLASGERIETHNGPDLDVLLLVVAGEGAVHGDGPTLVLTLGALVWLPRLCRRAVAAGSEGLSYLTVHRRRAGLTIGPADHN
ncbi:MAG TPA: DUF2249 domain-containing protein [Actinopolymorphaceae bacterium]|jgi:uncharacterized protein (DUF2249 family)